jgi:hypothetical protein
MKSYYWKCPILNYDKAGLNVTVYEIYRNFLLGSYVN